MSRGPIAIFRRVTLAEVIDHVAFEFGLDPATIADGAARTYPRQARYAVAWLASRHTRVSLPELAAACGVCVQTAREARRIGKSFRGESADFRVLTDRLDGMLSVLGEERAREFRADAPPCAVTTVPADVARLVRAVRALGGAVALPFIAERAELDAALSAFAFRVSTAAPAVAA